MYVIRSYYENIHVAADRVEEMVTAFTVHIAVSPFGNHREIRVDGFERRGHGQGTSVKAPEHIDVEVVECFCRLSDA